MIFDIFFATILFFAKNKWWKFACAGAIIIMISALFFTSEFPRGALGALFIGIFILILGYMIFSKNKLLKRLAPITLILIVLIIFGFSQTSIFKEKMMAIKDLPGEARRIVWEIGFSGWKDRPWLGWGLENFNIPFAKHFNPALPLSFDIWYDRVHNIVIDTLITSGILGLLSYLAIFVVAIVSLLRLCPKVNEIKNVFFPLGMIGLLIVYFLQNIWVFDMISSYMIFFLSLAFIFFLTYKEKLQTEGVITENNNSSGYNFLSIILGGLLIIITLLTLYFGNIQPARASQYIVQGLALPLEKSMPAFQKALAISPISKFEAPEQFSRKISDSSLNSKENKELLQKGFELSEEAMKNTIASNPLDYRFYLLLGRHYNSFYQFSNDGNKLVLAEDALKKAMELSPKNQQTFWTLAQTKLFQGKSEEALDLIQKAVDLEPRYFLSHWYLAMTYKILGKNELALNEIKEAEKLGYKWRDNLSDLLKVIEIYQVLGDNQNTILLFERAVELDPKNTQLWAGLADTYANLGEREKAKIAAERVAELDPSLKQKVDEFLKSLGY